MTRKAGFLRWLAPAIAIYALGFAAAAVWDLAIDQAVYTPGSLFAILMESFGWYPAFLPALLLFLMLMRPAPARAGLSPVRRVGRPVLCGIVAAAGFFAVYYASYGYLVGRGLLSGPDDFCLWLWLAAGVVFAAALAHVALGFKGALRAKTLWFSACGTVYMAANQAVVYLLKLLWGRTRFDTMLAAGSFADFTPWYRPFGPGGSSFPSGHTANAAGIFILLVLCDLLPKWTARRRLVTALCWGYVALMAFARVLIGRHFLSDTLAASAIMALLVYLLRHNRLYRRGLNNTLEKAAAAEETPDAF